MSLLSRKKSAVGLDIGTFYIRAVELMETGDKPEISSLVIQELPRGAVVDGEIIDTAAVSAAIKEIWKKGGFKNRTAVIGLANTKVLVRQVELPFMTEAELKGAINFQAQEYIPIPPKDLILDYQIVGEFVGEEDKKMLEVLLVAAHKEMVDGYLEGLKGAGVEPSVVYVSSLALVRSLLAEKILPDDKDRATVLVNIAGDISNVVVIEKEIPRFSRTITFGGNNFTQDIANTTGLEFEEAEKLKIEMGLKIDPAETDEKLLRAHEAIEREAKRFIDEIRRSIEYYFGQDINTLNIGRLIISGAGSEMKGLDKFIATEINVEIERGHSLSKVEIGENRPFFVDAQLHEPSLAVAVGLAMRGIQ